MEEWTVPNLRLTQKKLHYTRLYLAHSVLDKIACQIPYVPFNHNNTIFTLVEYSSLFYNFGYLLFFTHENKIGISEHDNSGRLTKELFSYLFDSYKRKKYNVTIAIIVLIIVVSKYHNYIYNGELEY